MIIPISYLEKKNPTIYNIEVLLDSESSLNIAKAPLLYNKKHAFSIEIDDTLNDLYDILFKLLNGGTPEIESGFTSVGKYITDGCGNAIPFKASTCAFIKRYDGESQWLDWLEHSELYGGNYLSQSKFDELISSGYGIVSHGFFSNLNEIPDLDVAVNGYVNWSESRYGFRPLVITAPGGVTFDYNYWKNAWFSKGALFVTEMSGGASDTVRIDNLNLPLLTEPIEMGRWSLEGINSSTMQQKIDLLMGNENSMWLRSFGHLIQQSNFIRYEELKSFLTYIETAYGKYGSDNLWVASVTDIASYLYCKNHISVTDAIDEQNPLKHTITIDTKNIPSFINKRMITLLFSSEANIIDVKVNGYNHTNSLSMINIKF